MKLKITAMFVVISSFAWSFNPACAQGDHHTGGGSFTEVHFKNFLNKLAKYTASPKFYHDFAGVDGFSKVIDYNKKNPNHTIAYIALHLNPILKPEKVFVDGVERDCVSGFTEETQQMFFQCNLDHFPELPASDATDEVKSPYYGDAYRLTLHEIFVQAGIEDQFQNEIKSDYPIASHLNVHLELFPDYMPGNAELTPAPVKKVTLVTEAQGSILKNSESGEQMTFVRGKANPSSQRQTQPIQGGKGFVSGIGAVTESENVAYALITLNARNEVRIVTTGEDSRGQSEITNLDDISALVTTELAPGKANATMIMNGLNLSPVQYSKMVTDIMSLAAGHPGKLSLIGTREYSNIKTIIRLLLSGEEKPFTEIFSPIADLEKLLP